MGRRLTPALSQTRLAEMVGGSRQSVNQAIGSFASRGMLHLEGRRMILDDLGALPAGRRELTAEIQAALSVGIGEAGGRPLSALTLAAYRSTYSWPDNSISSYMISSVMDRSMNRSPAMPS